MSASSVHHAQFSGHTTAQDAAAVLAAEITGKTILIIGASPGGNGAETARVLARHAGLVILAGRSRDRLQQTVDTIHADTPGANLRLLLIDLESFASVRKAADEVNSYAEPIHVLINNAALPVDHEYVLTEDGFESTWQVNYLSHFLFTNLLLPRLCASIMPSTHSSQNVPASSSASYSPRIVNVSGPAHRMVPFDLTQIGFDGGKTWSKWPAHSFSKTATALFTLELAKRLRGAGILCFCINPGVIVNPFEHDAKGKENQNSIQQKPGMRQSAFGMWKTTEEGSASHIIAAFDPDLNCHSGSYIDDCQIRNDFRALWACDDNLAAELWDESERMVKAKFL